MIDQVDQKSIPSGTSRDDSEVPTLGDLIREHREAKKLSRASLAKKAIINENSISKYEKAGREGGQFPSAQKLAVLCAVLEIEPAIAMLYALPKEHNRDLAGFFIIRDMTSDLGKAFETEDIEEFQDARGGLFMEIARTVTELQSSLKAMEIKTSGLEANQTELEEIREELKILKKNGPDQK